MNGAESQQRQSRQGAAECEDFGLDQPHPIYGEVCEAQTHRAPQHRNQQAFRQQVSDELRPACADGCANRDFPSSRAPAGEYQQRKVHAGDE